MYFAIYEADFESEIKDYLQTTDNPLESNESIFLATETRKEQRQKVRGTKADFHTTM